MKMALLISCSNLTEDRAISFSLSLTFPPHTLSLYLSPSHHTHTFSLSHPLTTHTHTPIPTHTHTPTHPHTHTSTSTPFLPLCLPPLIDHMVLYDVQRKLSVDVLLKAPDNMAHLSIAGAGYFRPVAVATPKLLTIQRCGYTTSGHPGPRIHRTTPHHTTPHRTTPHHTATATHHTAPHRPRQNHLFTFFIFSI